MSASSPNIVAYDFRRRVKVPIPTPPAYDSGVPAFDPSNPAHVGAWNAVFAFASTPCVTKQREDQAEVDGS